MTSFRLVPKERAEGVSKGVEDAYTHLLKIRTGLEAAVKEGQAAIKAVDAALAALESINFDHRRPYASPRYYRTGK